MPLIFHDFLTSTTKNLPLAPLKKIDPITKKFCTLQDSFAVLESAEYLCHWIHVREGINKCILIKFEIWSKSLDELAPGAREATLQGIDIKTKLSTPKLPNSFMGHHLYSEILQYNTLLVNKTKPLLSKVPFSRPVFCYGFTLDGQANSPWNCLPGKSLGTHGEWYGDVYKKDRTWDKVPQEFWLVNKNFLTCLLIGWLMCWQLIGIQG